MQFKIFVNSVQHICIFIEFYNISKSCRIKLPFKSNSISFNFFIAQKNVCVILNKFSFLLCDEMNFKTIPFYFILSNKY